MGEKKTSGAFKHRHRFNTGPSELDDAALLEAIDDCLVNLLLCEAEKQVLDAAVRARASLVQGTAFLQVRLEALFTERALRLKEQAG